MGLTSVFCMWTSSVPALFVDDAVFSRVCIFGTTVKCEMAVTICALVFGSSVVSHWSTGLFLCQYHIAFISISLI